MDSGTYETARKARENQTENWYWNLVPRPISTLCSPAAWRKSIEVIEQSTSSQQPLLRLLSRCPIFKFSHCNSSEYRSPIDISRLILGLRPANERRGYKLESALSIIFKWAAESRRYDSCQTTCPIAWKVIHKWFKVSNSNLGEEILYC